ncbi:MAG: nucleotidyl transferase AbiEii/AbiGii toxin family protein [Coprobacillaceae bacterium]
MDKITLTNKLKRISREKQVDFNMLLSLYFMEDFLTKIAKSRYQEYFIFKGGFLLSSILGISNRTTMDIDIEVIKYPIEIHKLEEMVKDIIKINNNYITYDIKKITAIREQDSYGGFNIQLLGHLENIRQPVNIDFATGDPITPSAIKYEYQPMIGDEPISINTYNLESIIAEKLQTIYERGIANSRNKDFYDIYLFSKMKYKDIDFRILSNAILETFTYRGTQWNYKEFMELINIIDNNRIMINRWKQYANSHSYATNIQFSVIITEVRKIIESIEKVLQVV